MQIETRLMEHCRCHRQVRTLCVHYGIDLLFFRIAPSVLHPSMTTCWMLLQVATQYARSSLWEDVTACADPNCPSDGDEECQSHWVDKSEAQGDSEVRLTAIRVMIRLLRIIKSKPERFLITGIRAMLWLCMLCRACCTYTQTQKKCGQQHATQGSVGTSCETMQLRCFLTAANQCALRWPTSRSVF